MIDREAMKATAREAQDLLELPVFQKAILDLRKEWFATLMAVDFTVAAGRVCN